MHCAVSMAVTARKNRGKNRPPLQLTIHARLLRQRVR